MRKEFCYLKDTVNFQLLGVLFSMNSEYDDFLLGGKLPEQLTFALSSALQLNAKRLRLSREVTGKSNVLGK